MLKDGVVTALGTMSGTSLDGVDAAVLQTDGERIAGFGPTAYRPYSKAERAVLQAHLGRWPEDDISAAKEVVEAAHLAVMAPFEGIDVAGFHGQTLAHDPGRGRTHQCGDGGRLARSLGYPVVGDFRSADMRGGGQGAPLAPFYHFALAHWIRADAPIAFLNLGGVGNITWVDPRFSRPEEEGALLAFDTGPANAPINDVMQRLAGVPYDDGGKLAAEGRVDASVLSAFQRDPYFTTSPPKSLDRNAFGRLSGAVSGMALADAVATLTQAAVWAVVQALALCPTRPNMLYVTGGGRKNRTMMDWLARDCSCDVAAVESAGMDGDMLEAQAFAYLAVRAARGLPISAPGTTGITRPAVGGYVFTG
ncbi:anhydro-N-acetylmuramic acid kinase [Yoonia sp. 2307UL14-13]|uniref:anhydro-N-acetylmuramic acid kinase n=1 Tax=Yoonia sp. 2307UL14-13 TaxID=3126506 RepID=UPI00309EEACE